MRDDQPEGWRRVRSTGRGNNKRAAAAACCRQHALCTAAAALQGAHLWPAQTSCPSSGASPAAERFDKKTSTQMPQAPVAVLPRALLRQAATLSSVILQQCCLPVLRAANILAAHPVAPAHLVQPCVEQLARQRAEQHARQVFGLDNEGLVPARTQRSSDTGSMNGITRDIQEQKGGHAAGRQSSGYVRKQHRVCKLLVVGPKCRESTPPHSSSKLRATGTAQCNTHPS